MSTNFVTIQGKLHNFVSRLVAGGKQVATFSIGFADVGKKGTFSYINVNAWGMPSRTIERINQGPNDDWSGSVIVVGRLKQETWEGKQGKKSEVKVLADDVLLLPPRSSDDVEDKPVVQASVQVQKPVVPKQVVTQNSARNTVAPRPVAPKPQRPVTVAPPPKPVVVEEPSWEEDSVEDQNNSYGEESDDTPF